MKWRYIALASSFLFLACDEPTLPEWDIAVRFPSAFDTTSIASLLPNDLLLESESIVLPEIAVSKAASIMDLCAPCSSFFGTPFVVPGFSFEDGTRLDIPEQLVSTTLGSGELDVLLSHDFPYELLANEAGEYGRIVVELVDSSGVVLASDSVSGEDRAFQPGTQINLSLDLSGIEIEQGIAARVLIESPGTTTPRTLDSSIALSYDIRLKQLRVDEVTIRHEGADIEEGILELSLSDDFRDRISSNVVGGRLDIEVELPFDVDGLLELDLGSAFGNSPHWIVRSSHPFATGRQHLELVINKEQLRGLLVGEKILVRYAGRLDPGIVTLSARDKITYKAVFDVTYTI